jgi:hypothetical protein
MDDLNSLTLRVEALERMIARLAEAHPVACSECEGKGFRFHSEPHGGPILLMECPNCGGRGKVVEELEDLRERDGY